MVVYPEGQFAGHVVPPNGRAVTLARQIQTFTVERKISWDKVKNLISDGCEKMVRWITGVHTSLEKIHKKPFGRIICFFHHLEEKKF